MDIVRFNLSISHKRPLFNNNTKAKIRRCTTYVEPYISSFYGMLLRCCWRGLSPALPGTRLGERTRAGRVPASYPTTSTRRLMNPTADARTGRKAYADCRRDCRNTGINIQRGQQEVNARALFPAPDGSFFTSSIGNALRSQST